MHATHYSECDSPTSLLDLTFDWIEKEWADQIDFVICTPLSHPSHIPHQDCYMLTQF